jgi:lysyl-tRNA synthetase class II
LPHPGSSADKVNEDDFANLKTPPGDFLASPARFPYVGGEITVEADNLTTLAKALQTLPEKWHGLR